MTLSARAQQELLAIAARAICAESQHHAGQPALPSLEELDVELQEKGACFVTLRRAGRLRGCVGAIEATEPLGCACARLAFSAAYRDPRFPPISSGEIPDLMLRVSVLTSPEPARVGSQAELLQFLERERCGLIVEWQDRRGTFLPEVWEHVTEPLRFLEELKAKAGIPAAIQPPELRVFHYRTTSISGNMTPCP